VFRGCVKPVVLGSYRKEPRRGAPGSVQSTQPWKSSSDLMPKRFPGSGALTSISCSVGNDRVFAFTIE